MSEILFEAKNVTKRFGGVVALKGVYVCQRRGETLGMIGPNGSGKTTFVNVVTGTQRPNGGTVLFDGGSIAGLKPYNVCRAGLTRTYQAVRVFGDLTGRDNVETAMIDVAHPLDAEERAAMSDWLSIGHRLDVRAGSLTLHEQRRLELLVRLVQRPKLIMLDEPVGGLSSTEVRSMIRLLSELKQHCNVFIIEHAMRVIRELADNVVVLVAGEKLAEGRPSDVLADVRVVEKYLGSIDA
jgi:ABC-type branched-subunit amino acid transport system ATPase component